ncbi:hypothetical protein NRB_17530 [Novosphingobium sp. 11B]
MSFAREEQVFPTRNYPYGRCARGAALPPDVAIAPDTLHARVLGLIEPPRPMTPDELAGLADPFGRLLRLGQPFPLTLRAVLARVDALAGADALADQLQFLVADGGHIVWSPETDGLARSFRFVVARGAGSFPLLISSSTAADSADDRAFLQIIGWDAQNEVFHYYERLLSTWFWAGSSPHALAPETRGQGPFDSHVNGSLVMKELRAPWIHWHAPLAGINADALAPGDPLRDDPLFTGRVTAERLETEVVRPGIRAWNTARVGKSTAPDGLWRNVPWFLRQAITSTTVNLASSDTPASLAGEGHDVHPPLSFFLNRDTLFDTLDLAPDDPAIADIVVPGALYRDCLLHYDVHRSDGAIRVDGDVHFAFLTPEPAFEDTHLVDLLVASGQLSPRFAACLTMVDFTNPVFSARREALLGYVPETVQGPDHAASIEVAFVAALEAAVAAGGEPGDPASAEREFLALWAEPAWADRFRARIGDYLSACRARAADAATVDAWFRLAEHRRRCFRKRPLAEFALTTPRTSIPDDAPGLRMTETGVCEPLA